MLYGRAQYDADMEEADFLDQKISIVVANGCMDGFEAIRSAAVIERWRKRCRGRLLATARILQEGKRVRHSKRVSEETEEIGNPAKWVTKTGKWGNTWQLLCE